MTLLILLPPSEAKTQPEFASVGSNRLDLESLSFPQFNAVRKKILGEVRELAKAPDVVEILKLKGAAAREFPGNADLLTASVGAAHEVYTGVLFQAIDFSSLSDLGRRRAASVVAIASALWGFTQPEDRIPAYRLTGGMKLPELGNLNACWRPVLKEVLGPLSENDLVLDCRSGTYISAWKPEGKAKENVVAVRVFKQELGQRTVVSHQAKQTRGQLARMLLQMSAPLPQKTSELVQAARQLPGCDVEVTVKNGQPQLDIMLDATNSPAR